MLWCEMCLMSNILWRHVKGSYDFIDFILFNLKIQFTNYFLPENIYIVGPLYPSDVDDRYPTSKQHF